MTTQPGRPSRSPTSRASRPFPAPITFDDLVADLTWPKLLQAGRLAVRPSRVVLGLVWLIGILGIFWVADRVDDEPGNVLLDRVQEIGGHYAGFIHAAFGNHDQKPLDRSALSAAVDLQDALLGVPTGLLRDHPFVTIIGLFVLIAWTALFGGAISRSAASDFSLGRAISWPEAMGFAVSKWRSLFGAILLPLLLLWLIAFGLAVGGLLLRVTGLNVLVGLAWGLFLFGGLIAATILTTFALGHTMLIPAVACEGTDAIDAVQHAYAYVFAKPLRLVLYSLILIIQAVIVISIAAFIVFLTLRVTGWSAQGFAGDRGQAVIADVAHQVTSVAPTGKTGGTLSDTDRYTSGIIQFWCAVLGGLGAGVGVSIYWTSCTLLYLAMRRVCDGQDVHELWSPGLIEGTLAPATAPAMSPAPIRPGETVSDTGPADET